tara:strand:- start:2738 stop:2947 length:210 start_codon:yes stop_codon:yes gene_type:complete
MKVNYAGSVEYDNYDGEWCDQIVEAETYSSFLFQIKELITLKRNSKVFFANRITNGKEHDITEEIINAL